jgi:hypothetical protein
VARPLRASTGVKDPAHRDTRYGEELDAVTKSLNHEGVETE